MKATHSAKDEATRRATALLQNGHLSREAFNAEWTKIYEIEYYKFMAKYSLDLSLNPETSDDSPEKFPTNHTLVKFTKRNFFIQVDTQKNCITVSPMSILSDFLVSLDLEMCDMFLNVWPGPLRSHSPTGGIIDYITTLQQNEFQRKKKLLPDDQRTTIWNLLMKLLLQHGNVSGPDMAEMLLDPGDTKINENDETINKFIKQLLLGKRKSAIEYAASHKLWPHAQCLSFLDKYQPVNCLPLETKEARLLEDPIVSLNSRFIADLECHLVHVRPDQTRVQIDLRPVHCLYRTLLNQILKQWDRNSLNQIPVVSAKDSYLFAILISNECDIIDIDYDTSSELFKLIVAIRNKDRNHIINFGQLSEDSRSDDLSHRSLLSFVQTETIGSRVQTISNPELLILNEVWEFARNLSNTQSNYEYLINLVPYKIIFASKLLDYGMTQKCYGYIEVIKEALKQIEDEKIYGHGKNMQIEDVFYNWQAIRSCVDYLSEVCATCEGRVTDNGYESLQSYALEPQARNSIDNSLPIYNNSSLHDNRHYMSHDLSYSNVDRNVHESGFNGDQFEEDGVSQSKEPPHKPSQEVVNDVLEDRYKPPLPEYQLPPFQAYKPPPVPEVSASETYNANVHYSTNANEPAISSPQPPPQPQMTTSSPIQDDMIQHDYTDNPMNSFGSPISPLNEYDNGPIEYPTPRNSISNEKKDVGPPKESSQSGDQQPSSSLQTGMKNMLSKMASSIIPQNKAKPMILPKENSMYFDNNLKRWVDPNNPDDANNSNDVAPPPKIPVGNETQPKYTFAPSKSYKPSKRYPEIPK